MATKENTTKSKRSLAASIVPETTAPIFDIPTTMSKTEEDVPEKMKTRIPEPPAYEPTQQFYVNVFAARNK